MASVDVAAVSSHLLLPLFVCYRDAADMSECGVNHTSQKSTPIGHNSRHKSQEEERQSEMAGRQKERSQRGKQTEMESKGTRERAKQRLIECICGGVA